MKIGRRFGKAGRAVLNPGPEREPSSARSTWLCVMREKVLRLRNKAIPARNFNSLVLLVTERIFICNSRQLSNRCLVIVAAANRDGSRSAIEMI